jgi:hypothetical protein
MANEISLTARLNVVKNSRTLMDFNPGTLRFDMSGTRGEGQKTQTIGTTAEQVLIGSDVGTEGYAFFRNDDPTNYLEISAESAVTSPLVKLKAGRVAIFPLATGTFYAKSNTAACDLTFGVVED